MLVSCQESPIYDQVLELSADSWSYQDTLEFEISAPDTAGIYELQLDIKHREDYAYENLYMMVTTQFPDGKEKEERLSINLADKSGKWLGNCNGEQCRLKVYLLEKFKFPGEGRYTFKFVQHTRDANLYGIDALKLQLYSQPNTDASKTD